MRSLQRRVIIGGLVWAVIATLIGGIALATIFDQIANRRFNEILNERHTQVIVALGDTQSPQSVEAAVTDPAFGRVYSGRYWQLVGENGDVFTSPSLFDAVLPKNMAATEAPTIWEGSGPNGTIRGIRERVTLEDGSTWTVSVATSLNALAVERAEMRRSVAFAFGLVGLLGIAGAGVLTTVMIGPLRKLGADVRNRWDSENALVPDDYPTEVAPLVKDINELIGRNRDILDRGRRQAADLAHALKTPSAALRNELVVLSQTVDDTAPLFEALDRIDAQIVRSLARMRAASAENAVHIRTDVDQAVQRIARLFRSLPEAQSTEFEVSSYSAAVAIDAQDLEEIIGNLLENAFKWCKSAVSISVEERDGLVLILVEDDGPGIAEEQRNTVLQESSRLDTSVPGTGLGLSIVNDLASAYGGSLELGRSKRMGGLCCCITLLAVGRQTDAAPAVTA